VDKSSKSCRSILVKVSSSTPLASATSIDRILGFLQGYTMTGRTGIFPTYESFLPIVATMMVQYSKFLKIAAETSWRRDLSSINYISTSTWTRQEHNGLSHQNPGFIGSVLALKASIARVYLPPDPNTFLSTLAHCLRSKNYINLIVGSKHVQPVWLSAEEADAHCMAGASVWKFCSTDNGLDPDVVLVGIGADLMFEVIAAAAYLRHLMPALKIRVVNVTDLMVLGLSGSHPHSLSHAEFDALFTADQHIHFNYHGYPVELQGLLFGRPNLARITVEGYCEEGTTTTPFDMVIRNRCSRYHVALAAIKGVAAYNSAVAMDLQRLTAHIQHDLKEAQQYICKHWEDPKGTYDKPTFSPHHSSNGHGWLNIERGELHPGVVENGGV
jgi:xylulose-5-phosphate/fructose-6-phosphate phosphoketolase